MDYFAHIFFGNEFAEIISNIAKQVCINRGGELTSSVNLFMIDEKNLRTLVYPQTPVSDTDIIANDGAINTEWQELGAFTGKDDDDKKLFLDTVFNKIMTVGNAQANKVLHVLLHFPLYKPEALDAMTKLHSLITSLNRPIQVNFMGYCDDICPIIEPGYEIKSKTSAQIKKFNEYRKKAGVSNNNSHFIAIQNCSQSGIALGLDIESLSDIIAQFAMLCSEHYLTIFPRNVEYLDAIAFGISTLHLDKYLFVKYLLNKTLLAAMDNANINDTQVNVNDAAVNAGKIFFDKTRILSGIMANLDKLQKPDNDVEFEKIRKKYEEEVQAILDNCKTILAENESINMKAAIIAACLAKTDCELFTDTVFMQEIVSIDKLFDEPINFYIKNDRAKYYTIDDEPIVNPIPLMQELDKKLLNSETDIRRLQNQIGEYEKQLEETEKAVDYFVEDGFYHYKNQKFQLLPSVEQEPLAETYTAHEVNVSSLDLRNSFTPIKNQGQQGSCLAFSLTSIFEYVMQLNKAQDVDLSEAFLYYNARNMDANADTDVNKDTGSRYKPAIDSLAKYGLASEKVWPYREDVYSQKPSDAAYEDASKRKLISAMNVQRKIADIKSALVDGCPVAGSFVLTRSFYEMKNGYVNMPTEEEIDECLAPDAEKKKHGHHAMVIVGFSDEIQMFIVRNSWGIDFGEKGYCYIPYAYIENERLFNYACIITEIESMPTKKIETVTPLKINTNDLAIQHIIAQINLKREEELANGYRQDKSKLKEYFETLKSLLSNQNDRDNFIEANKNKISEEQEELREKRNAKDAESEKNDEEYRTFKKSAYIRAGLFVVGAIIFWTFFYNCDDSGNNRNWITWGVQWGLFATALVLASIYLFSKDKFRGYITSFWLSFVTIPAVILSKSAIAVLYDVYFEPKADETWTADIFKTDDYWYWIVFAILVSGVIFFIKCHKRYKEWIEIRTRIEKEINDINKEINNKEREKALLKLKTFASWQHIVSFQNLSNKLYAKYTALTSLINNMRNWYKEFEENENECSFESKVPNISLLTKEKLDKFFEEKLAKDEALHIDFCEKIENYKVEEGAMLDFKKELLNKIVIKILERRELRDFDVAEHAATNAFKDIAFEITRETGRLLEDSSNVFMMVQSVERPVITPLQTIFMPSANRSAETRKNILGPRAINCVELNDKHRLTVLNTMALSFDECVNFQ